MDALEWFGGVGGDEAEEGGFEVEVEEDFADVDEGGGGGHGVIGCQLSVNGGENCPDWCRGSGLVMTGTVMRR